MGLSSQTNAAYCSLRDPVIATNTLFPEANNHRSIVRKITQAQRNDISQQLPFSLHFNEIGQHTLYAIQQEKQTVGFIHSRSELSNRGILEIAWAINLDMTIRGFFIQRCRSPQCQSQAVQFLSKDLQNKGYSDLISMLDLTSNQLTPALQLQYGDKSDLVLSLIRSALKTLSITQIAWADDIGHIQRQLLADKHFNSRAVISSQASILQRNTLEALKDTIIQANTVKPYSVLDEGENVIGHIVEAGWQQGDLEGNIHWLFSPGGTVLDIQTIAKWPNTEVKNAFNDVIGKNFATNEDCNTTVESAGNSLFTSLFGAP